MEIVRYPGSLPVGATLADALRVYRLLFQRSVLVAAIVYGVIALLQILAHVESGGAAALLGLLVALCTLAGPALVQGALIEIVRNVHEGRAPESTRRLFSGARARVLTLIAASFVYAFGIALGLILLVVPGLIVFARWSLMPAVVMLEGRGVGEARRRSADLVRGNGVAVFACLIVAALAVGGVSVALLFVHLSFGTQTFAGFVWTSLTAPFLAHLLTVVYYRRAESQRPVIHPEVMQWRNVWEGR